jgi:hypothetical protein
MRARIQQTVRYWSFLVCKLALAAALTGGLVRLVDRFSAKAQFGYDLLYTTVIGIVFLTGYGLVRLAFLDQRYRCRACLRRLRMPVETGSWSRMLQFGRPRIEYICTYGHGKLNVEELQFAGTETPSWHRHRDMWDELFR